LEFSKAALITNYQGSGYVYDYVRTTLTKDGKASFFATDVHVEDYSPVYEEETECQLVDEHGKGSMRIFVEGSTQPTLLKNYKEVEAALFAGRAIRTFQNYTACPFYIG
jgi:hypothetical protein